jgi:predicted NBD/HSP70 family sugar kinase
VHYLSDGLSIIVNVLDPDAIILGGGVGNIDLLYTDVLREQLAIKTFTPQLKTAILKPKLGDSAGVFGAAMYGAS